MLESTTAPKEFILILFCLVFDSIIILFCTSSISTYICIENDDVLCRRCNQSVEAQIHSSLFVFTSK